MNLWISKIKAVFLLTKFCLKLQRKDTPTRLFISVLPLLFTAFTMEYFVVRLFNLDHVPNGEISIKFLIYMLISNSIISASRSLLNNAENLKRSRLEFWYWPVAELMLNAFIVFICLGIVQAFHLYSPLVVVWNYFVFFCCILLLIFVSISVACLTAVFRDTEHLINLCTQLLFWLSPILYSFDGLPESVQLVLALNPFSIIFVSLAFSWGMTANISFLLSFASAMSLILLTILVSAYFKQKIKMFL